MQEMPPGWGNCAFGPETTRGDIGDKEKDMNERQSVIDGFEKNLLEIKRRHEAGEITSEKAFELALEEGNRAWEAMPEPKPVLQ